MPAIRNLLFGISLAFLFMNLTYANVSVTASSSASTTDIGSNVVLSAHASGGSGNFTYEWFNATSGTNTAISNTNSMTYTFAAESNGIYSYYVSALDSANSTDVNQSAAVSITVNYPPRLTLASSANGIKTGSSATLTASASNGTSPFTYSWTVNDNALSDSSSQLVFYGNDSTVGNDMIAVNAVDSTGQSAGASIEIMVNKTSLLPLVINEFLPTDAKPITGGVETIDYNFSGGEEPYSLMINIYNTTELIGSESKSPAVNGSYSFNLVKGYGTGTFTAKMVLTDPAGQNTTGSTTFDVVSNSTSTSTSSSTTNSPSTTSSSSTKNTTIPPPPPAPSAPVVNPTPSVPASNTATQDTATTNTINTTTAAPSSVTPPIPKNTTPKQNTTQAAQEVQNTTGSSNSSSIPGIVPILGGLGVAIVAGYLLFNGRSKGGQVDSSGTGQRGFTRRNW
jgi:hypothetical protein